MIPLNPPPSEQWTKSWLSLMRDDWLQRKLNRQRRWPELEDYVRSYCGELRLAEPGLVIDIGPGPGDFLEIARSYGHTILGIDAATGTGGMGTQYLKASRMMTERQDVPVTYSGLIEWLQSDAPNLYRGQCVLINSRGSIEQALSSLMEGQPHDEHHDCNQLSWKEQPGTVTMISLVFTRLRHLLRPGGSLLIYANGASNTPWYSETVAKAAAVAGLTLEFNEGGRVHKWKA